MLEYKLVILHEKGAYAFSKSVDSGQPVRIAQADLGRHLFFFLGVFFFFFFLPV